MENYHLASTITSRSRSYPQRFRQWPVKVYMTSESGAVQVDQTRNRVQASVFVKDQQ